MIDIFIGNWNYNIVKNNKNKIFIFGDNDLRIGKGGQAIIRDLKNTIGIRTKKEPNNYNSSFYSDNEYSDNIKKIDHDIQLIKNEMIKGHIIVFSNGGYGTGLAKLNVKAPKTFKYLCDVLMNNFNYDNLKGEIIQK